jgi:16S rRNA (guanine966-N2)-methyltransferase
MKIIAGKHKSRAIPTVKKADYRPSTAKLREAIFSIISSGEFLQNPVIEGAKVLDICSGTGSLAFESLSRGAEHITLIDNQVEYLRCARDFAEKIGEGENITVLHFNALNLPKSAYKYNLIFIDPPYHKNMVAKTISGLIAGNWLQEGAILVIEMAKTDDYVATEQVKVIKEKKYGNSKLLLLEFSPKI